MSFLQGTTHKSFTLCINSTTSNSIALNNPMVGFVQESCKEEDESVVNQQKIKNWNYPESFRFDFEGYSSEFGGFSLASAEPFLDFDSIKDWIEEMQVPDSAPEATKAETESRVCIESCLEDQISNRLVDSVQDVSGSEKPVSVNAEFSVPDEDLVSRDGRGSGDSLIKLDGTIDSGVDGLTTKAELGSSELAEIDSDGHHGDRETSHADVDESSVRILGDKNCHKVESLGCSIEEGLEKVTLVGDEAGLVVYGSDMKKVDTPVVNEDSDSDSDSESECKTSSSSSSSSESDDDDEEEEEEEEEELKAKKTLCESKNENTKQTIDTEEGQIVDSDAENIVSWSANEEEGEEEDDDVNFKENSEEFHIDDEDEDADIVKGPIKSKNELEVLPPVPPVNVTLQPCHEIMPVGVVSSVLGTQIVVEGSEKHNPLSEGSILWVAETRLPLGLVDEIFGPVKTPFYIVRHNSESEVPSGIQNGTLVGFVPEFVGHLLNDKNLYQKGYDASGENDEEVLDEYDFSDDEKEAEYKRLLKMSKRGNNNQVQGSGNKKNRKNKNRDKTWTKDQPSSSQSPALRSSQPSHMHQHVPRVPISSQGNQLGPSPIRQVISGRPAVPPSSQGNQSGPSPIRHVLSGGPCVPPSNQGNQLGPSQMRPTFPNGPMAFPHQMQQAGSLLNGLFSNGMPFQQQNMSLPGGFQMNGMPWLQQNHPQNFQVPSAGPAPWQQQQQHVMQMPLSNPAQCQQPFDLSQLVSGAAQTPLGPSNFSAGPTNAPWLGMLGQNLSNQTPQNVGLQGASQLSAMQGQSFNSQPWLGMLGQNLSNQASQNVGLQGASLLPAMQGQSFNSQPWLGMLGQNLSNQAQQNVGLQGTSQLPAMQGQSFNSQPPTSFHGNEGASPQFSQGSSSGRGGRGGRGRGRRPFHHRGGHSGSGRGRQQPN